MTNIFDRAPPYGLVYNWLGPQMVERLVRFAESQEHQFADSSVSFGDKDHIDSQQTVSKTIGLSSLKTEVKA